MNAVDAVLVMAFIALVAVLFVLAMGEASLLHVRRSAVAAELNSTDKQSQRLLRLLDDLPKVMNAVLLAVLLTQVTATALAGVLAERWVGSNGITIATLVVTLVLFVYGEAIPKTIAIADPVLHARRLSGVVATLSAVLRPVVAILVQIAQWQAPGIRPNESPSVVSELELRHLTGEAAAAGEIDQSDAELIEKSFTLGDLRVGEIMVPISDVVSVTASTPVEAALNTAIDAGHRRLIVYADSSDQPLGFVRLRDLSSATLMGGDTTAGTHVLRALRVDRGALVIDALREMQQTRCFLAIATNGGAAAVGIVTIEDIFEQLLGDVDEADPQQRRDDRSSDRRRQ